MDIEQEKENTLPKRIIAERRDVTIQEDSIPGGLMLASGPSINPVHNVYEAINTQAPGPGNACDLSLGENADV